MKRALLVLVFCLFLPACADTNRSALDFGDETQLQKRSYQSRVFDTGDKEKVMRAIIATMQDLGFIIERADLALGMASGVRADYAEARLTVSARPRGEGRMLVRANAQYGLKPVEDPKQYQAFFTSLGKSLFLEAQAVE